MDVKILGATVKDALLWRYAATSERLYSPELGRYVSYGLVAEVRNGSVWNQVEFIHDITTDRLVARQMAELFTEHQLSGVHLRDAVEDMLP